MESGMDGRVVLVVDDNTMNQRMAAFALSALHVQHEVCKDGVAAFERLKRPGVALVLMDLEMPGMDGFECTRRIRRDLQLKLPVVAMTAHEGDELKRAMEAGMDGHISKPITTDNLQVVLNKHLGSASH